MNNKADMSSSPNALPTYKKPPVNEVVCGIRFETPNQLRLPHVGLLWDKFRSKYPKIKHAPPIGSGKGEIPLDKETGIPLQRVWFINESDDQLIQFQFDRFYFNWRRRQNEYPRYIHIIDNFKDVQNTIKKFFDEFELGKLSPVELELSYINHIPKGEGWETIDDLPKIFTDFVWNQENKKFLPNPEKVGWQTEFPLPEKKGYLHVNLKQAILTTDKIPLLILELTARGDSKSPNIEAATYEWFNLAHEWIVRGFTDLTTLEIQKFWEREENA